MNVQQITQAAKDLGIRPAAAPAGSPAWECWADRVELAHGYELDINHAMNCRRPGDADLFVKRRDEAIAEANRYAPVRRAA